MPQPDRWPFADDPMTPSVTQITVARGGAPVLYAEHSWDGTWSFFDGKTEPDFDNLLTVGLVEAVGMDPALREVAALPHGFFAARETAEGPWKVGYTGDPADEDKDPAQ